MMSNDGDRSAPAPLASAIDAASSGAGGDAGATGRGGAADALAAQGTTAPAPADELMAKAERSTAPETPTGSNSDAGTGSEGADKKWFEVIPVVLEKVRERGNEAPSQFALPRCARCSPEGNEPAPEAEIKCLTEDCEAQGVPSCAACFIKAHAPLKGPGHRIQDLSKCPLCQLERVAFWCRDCDLVFCDTCYSDVHSVRRARTHRRFAVEGASGKKISKANWSSHFHANVMQVLAILKRPYSTDVRKPAPIASKAGETVSSDSADSALNGKRKREFNQVEVITIDSDNDSDSAGDQTPTTGFKRMNSAPHSNSMIRPSSAPHLSVNNGASSSSEVVVARAVAHQLQPVATMQYAPITAPAHYQAPSLPSSMPTPSMPLPEPLPFPQELMAEDSPFGNVSSCGPSPYGSVNTASSSGQQHSAFNAGYNSATMGVSSRGFNVPPIQTTGVGNSTSGWATTSPATSTPVSVVSDSTPVNRTPANGMMMSYNVMMPGAAAVNSANPLVEAMLERYDAQNRAVYELACRIQQLNQEIVTAASRGPYAATPLMAELSNTQTTLKAALARRDRLFVIVIVQSADIIRKVRQLRMTELMNVPQVPPLSHRKCLQLSYTINNHKSTLQNLNEQLATAISSPGMANASAVNMTIQQLSSSIAAHEQSMRQLIEDRQSEFVRIVQFSDSIREALKQEFRRFQQQQQQQMQHQQAQPYRVP